MNFYRKKYKKALQTTSHLQYSHVYKVTIKLSKCIKNATYFLYFYNTPILLTNKIIK